MSALFRSAAMAKISNPDQLDRVLQVVRPLHVVGLIVIALVLLAGFVWSVLSTAPVKVQGQGILLSIDGVADVTAPNTGRIERLLVQPGDAVAAGQAVALLSRPAALEALNAKRAELADVRGQLAMLQTMHIENSALQNALTGTKRQAVQERLAKLGEQRRTLLERRRNEEELRGKGFVTANKVNETDARIAELDNQIASLRNNDRELTVQQKAEQSQKEQQIREAALRVALLERQLQNMSLDYDRDRVVSAQVSGSVVELSLNAGDMVSPGASVMRVLAASAGGEGERDAVHAIIFVSNNDGKKVNEGMAAQIMPSTTKLQKDGFIHGTVIKVAKIPSSREGMMRRLKNATLVDSLLRTGAPFEMEVALEKNPQAPSGYRWSSGAGPDISVDVGTMAQANMVVGQQRIISLALPVFDNVFRWLGVH